jgi:hypothetical protein
MAKSHAENIQQQVVKNSPIGVRAEAIIVIPILY